MSQSIAIGKSSVKPGFVLSFRYKSIETPRYKLHDINPFILFLGAVREKKGVLWHGINLHYLNPTQMKRLVDFVKPRILRVLEDPNARKMGTSFAYVGRVFDEIVDVGIEYLLRRYANRSRISINNSYNYYHQKLKRVIGEHSMDAYRTYYSQNINGLRVLDDRYIHASLRRLTWYSKAHPESTAGKRIIKKI